MSGVAVATMRRRNTRAISRELSAAYDLMALAERSDALRRYARRYLAEHCDRAGNRLTQVGLTEEEYAREAGLALSTFRTACKYERRGLVSAGGAR